MSATMGASRLDEIARLLKDKSDEVQKLYDACGDDGPRRDDYQRVLTLNKEQDDLLLERQELVDAQDMRRKHEERRATLSEVQRTVPYAVEKKAEEDDDDEPRRRIRLSKAILDDPGIKAWLASVKPGGRVMSGRFGNSPAVELKSLISTTSPTTGQPFLRPQYDTDIMLPTRPLNIRSVITVTQTGADSIQWVEQTGRTNNAAPWAIPPDVASATLKPESDLTFTPKTTNVVTIPTWIPVVRQTLDDLPQMRGIIDTELTGMVEEELEDQIVNGTGVGNQMLGMMATTGYTPQAFDTDVLVTTRKAITQSRVTALSIPTAFLMNPLDWEAIDLMQDGNKVFYYGGPQQLGTPTLWGLPVVQSMFLPVGTAFTGNLRAAKLWDREQASIFMTDSHADWFLKNIIAILAEIRAAFAVQQPARIVKIGLATVGP